MSDYIEKTVSFPGDYSITLDGGHGGYNLGTYKSGYSRYVEISAAELREFAAWITENIPEPDVLDTATFIKGYTKDEHGAQVFFVKKNGLWYSEIGSSYTEEELRALYMDFEDII